MDINNKEDKIKLVKQTIEKIRPYLQRDGGDVEFVSLKDGVMALILDEVPGIKDVRLADIEQYY